MPCRSIERPAETFMAPLSSASRPLINCDRVGVHMGET